MKELVRILNREEPGNPVREDDNEQHKEAKIVTGFAREAEINGAVKNLRNA